MGASLNHYKLIKKAYENNYNNILILEDDAVFKTPLNYRKLERVFKWMKDKNDWDIFYFGYCQWPLLISYFVNTDIVRVMMPQAIHCYCLSRRGMKKIIYKFENHYKNESADIFFAKDFSLKKYAIYPQINFQSVDPKFYKAAVEKLGITISFEKMSKISENLSLVIPVILVLVCLWLIYRKSKIEVKN